MENLLEIQRVVYSHDWQCVAEWAGALGELADLTDDQIDSLARSEQYSNPQRSTPRTVASVRTPMFHTPGHAA